MRPQDWLRRPQFRRESNRAVGFEQLEFRRLLAIVDIMVSRDVVVEDDSLDLKIILTRPDILRPFEDPEIVVNLLFEDGTAIGGSSPHPLVPTISTGTDFVDASTTVKFEVGETTKVIPVTIVPDDRYEPDETFSITADVVGASPTNSPSAEITILNDDQPPGFSVTQNDGTTEMQIGDSDSVEVVLHSEPESDVVIKASTDDGRELSLTFSPPVWDLPQVIIFASGPNVGSTPVTFAVDEEVLSDSSYSGVDEQTIDWVVRPQLFTLQSRNEDLNVATGQPNFIDVALTSEPSTDVVLILDYDAEFISTTSNELRFTPENWSQPQAVTISAGEKFGRAVLSARVDESKSDQAFGRLGRASLEINVLPPTLADPIAVSAVTDPDHVVAVGGMLFLAKGDELWAYDPTNEMATPLWRFTHPIHQLGSGALDTGEEHLILASGRTGETNLLNGPPSGMWSSDGTAEGMRKLGSAKLSEERYAFDIIREFNQPFGGGTVLSITRDSHPEVYVASFDGFLETFGNDRILTERAPWFDFQGETYTFSTTELVRLSQRGSTSIKTLYSNISSSLTGWSNMGTTNVVMLGDRMLFGTRTAENFQLWSSDGTEAGTNIIQEFDSTPPSTELVIFKDRVYFVANAYHLGDELWYTDGTTSGTALFKDLAFGSASSKPMELTVMNNSLFFHADDAVHGRELWKTDGAETVLVRDMNEGGDGIHAAEIIERCKVHYFDWTVDVECTFGTRDAEMTEANGTLFFVANDGVGGTELWKSDGTEAGTVSITNGEHAPEGLKAIRGSVFFELQTDLGTEYWLSNALPSGTKLIGSKVDDSADDSTNIVVAGDQLFQLSASTDHQPLEPRDLPDPVGPNEVLLGDADGDGEVGFSDFLILSANFQKPGPASFTDGDFTGNGFVTFADFLVLSSNFGRKRV